MKVLTKLFAFTLMLLLLVVSIDSYACSVCKVTVNGRTYIGSNEDNWRTGSRIWFENKTFGKLGAVYVGYGDNFPQGGMNEAGLAFDGLTVYPKDIFIDPRKTTETNSNTFIREIMQNCKTVQEVRDFAIKFNRPFKGGVVFFVDKFGKYLIMEPDTMTIGDDDKYIIANFCPSNTTKNEKLNFERYKRGDNFILNHVNDTNSNYCLALLDTMHECRNKIGDGTLYSFIADLDSGNLKLYFYHDFKHYKEFNLKTELAKGNHTIEMLDIFPSNIEYKRLINFKTPFNNIYMRLFLICCEIVFSFSLIFFLVSYLRKSNSISELYKVNPKIKLLLFSINVVMLYYVNALLNNQAIFYFPSPYKDWRFPMLTIAAYIPFLILILIIPLIIQNIKVLKDSIWLKFSKYLFTLNSLAYLVCIVLFTYWNLYDVF